MREWTVWILVLSLGQPDVNLKSEKNHGDISSILEIDRSAYRSGPDHWVKVTLTIRNDSGRPIPVTFGSGQQYDFSVEDEAGKQYWKWSDGKFFTMALVERELGQESWVYKEKIATVDEREKALAPGVYVLRAKLVADRRVENFIRFRIE